MTHPTAQAPPRFGGECGYAMAALIVGIAVMGVLASVALPVLSQSLQRDKEAELVFRGEQYARAVGLFQRKMGPGTLPPNLDVLVDQKFLRKKFKDPMTGKDFRPLTMGEAAASGAGGAAGRTQQGGERAGAFQGAPGSAGLGGIPTGLGGAPGGLGSGSGLGSGGGLGQGGLQGGLGQGGGLGGGLQGGGVQGGIGGQGGVGGIGGRGGPGQQGQPGQPQGGIVGVVSTSKGASLRLYNGRSNYNEWAFVYNPQTQVAGGAAGAGGIGGAAGGIGGGPGGGPGGRPGSLPLGMQPGSQSSPIGAPGRPGQSTPQTTNPGISGSTRR